MTPAYHTAQCSTWRRVVALVVFAVVMHQFVMALPIMHAHVMPMRAAEDSIHRVLAMQHMGVEMPAVTPSSSARSLYTMPFHPVEMRVCAAVEAVLSAPTALSFLLLLLLLTLIAYRAPLLVGVPSLFASGRLMPSARYRAFLQVFLC